MSDFNSNGNALCMIKFAIESMLKLTFLGVSCRGSMEGSRFRILATRIGLAGIYSLVCPLCRDGTLSSAAKVNRNGCASTASNGEGPTIRMSLTTSNSHPISMQQPTTR